MTTIADLPYPPRYYTDAKYTEYSSVGHAKIKLIENYLTVASESYHAQVGDPFILLPWQREIILALHERKTKNRLRYRRGLILLPKKSGKSPLLAALGVADLILLPVNSVLVILATSKDQTKNIFTVASYMAKHSAFADRLEIRRDSIYNKETGSVLIIKASDIDTLDGIEPTKVYLDEIHRHKNADLWNLMSQSLGSKPNGQLIGISTAGDPNDRDQICTVLYEYGKDVAEGKVLDESFFFRSYEADPRLDWRDPETWKMANPSYGTVLDEESFANDLHDEHSFRRFRLNQWLAGHNSWSIIDFWKDLADESLSLKPGDNVVLGFDGSWSNDSTGLVACRLSDLYVEVIDLWERPKFMPDDQLWHVDHEDVEDAIRKACRDYSVSYVLCDKAFWANTLSRLSNEGLPIVDFTQSPQRMVPAVREFERVVREKRLKHNGDPRLAEHIGNTKMRYQRNMDGYMIAKDKRSPDQKIDLAVASLMAVAWATEFREEKKPTRVRARIVNWAD